MNQATLRPCIGPPLRESFARLLDTREHDARANGVRAIGVLWGYGSRDELARAGADALVAAPHELARRRRVDAPLSAS